jgi:biopolymer transport protein ExbB
VASIPRRIKIVLALAAGLVGLAGVTAVAQDTGGTTERMSFLTILVRGAEAPGTLILLMSIVAVALIVEHFITIRPSTMAPAEEIERARTLIEGRRYRDCVDALRGSRTMFAHVLGAGLQHGRHGFDAMYEAIEDTTAAWSNRLFRKVEYLNVLGNLGPLMGLLGTVVGMIRAFSKMQETHGGYKTEDLAGGISLALVNTFLGLVLAIVALGFFGVCRNRVDRWTVEARAAAMDLLEYFRPGAVPTSAPAPPPGAPAAAPRGAKPESTPT